MTNEKWHELLWLCLCEPYRDIQGTARCKKCGVLSPTGLNANNLNFLSPGKDEFNAMLDWCLSKKGLSVTLRSINNGSIRCKIKGNKEVERGAPLKAYALSRAIEEYKTQKGEGL